VSPTADTDALAQAAAGVDALYTTPRLLALVNETRTHALGPGEVGLAVRNDTSGVLWCLLAGDPSTHTDLDALARAFVWPSYARARAPESHLAQGDAFADAIHRHAAGGVIVLLSPIEGTLACAKAVDLMLDTRSRRPLGASVAPRHIGRVLRDFEDAVTRGDATAAHDLLDEAWSTGRLSVVNRSFLQTRELAAQRAWQEVLDHALRHRLSDLDLPRSVEHDLVKAIYWGVLRDALDRGDIASALDAFRDRVQPALGDIFRDHHFVPSAEGRKAWMVRWGAVGGVWPSAVRDEVIAAAATAEERTELNALATHAQFSDSTSEAFARALLSAHEDAAAFALAQVGSDLPLGERAGVLVQAAVRLDDPARLADAAQAVEAAGGPTEVAAPAALAERIANYPRPAVPVDSWATWLSAIYENPEWSNAIQVADDQGEAWTESLAHDQDSLVEEAAIVEALAGENALRMVLPRLVRAVIPTGPQRLETLRSRGRILQGLAYAISEDPASGLADLDALADILAALLETGLAADEFNLICDQIETVWRRAGGAPRLARWIVDVLTVLTDYPCPSTSRRAALIGALLAPLLTDAGRSKPLIPREAWLEIDDLLEGNELKDLVPESIRQRTERVDDDIRTEFAHLANRNVLIHTLVPAVAERAAAYLKTLEPSARVITDESHVGSTQLREHARNADYIVIASRASKHAATEFIREEASSPISWPSGKGWSSIVDALRSNPSLS
jgi:hypothetical protein